MRPNGVCASTCFRNSLAAKPAVCRPSVSTIPGLIAFTRMLRGQLLGEGPGDGVVRRLGGAVDRCVRRRDRAGARADVDDAADQALGLGPLDESTDLGAPERVGRPIARAAASSMKLGVPGAGGLKFCPGPRVGHAAYKRNGDR